MSDTLNSPSKSDPRIYCFEKVDEEAEFEAATMKLLSKLQEPTRRMFVSEDNVLRMNHGRRWVYAANKGDDEPTDMHVISAEWELPFRDIAENNLGLISRTILLLKDEMEKQFSRNMYDTVGAAAEKVGNVVDARAAGSLAHSMLEMLGKIELGVDRDGNVSMPQFHVGPGMIERIQEEMKSINPEMDREIEKLKSAKIEEALSRELDRKNKFKSDIG